MKRYLFLTILLGAVQLATAQESSLKDKLKRVAEDYCKYVNYFMSDLRSDPNNLRDFQNLFLRNEANEVRALIYNNLPQQKEFLTIREYAIALRDFSEQTKLTFERIGYCRHSSRQDVFYIHVQQSYQGDYRVQSDLPQQVAPLAVTLTVQKNAQKQLFIVGVKKAMLTDAQRIDSDADEIPLHCDKCPQMAGSLEDDGADPVEDCEKSCFSYTVQPPQWKEVTQKVKVRPNRFVTVPATFETVTERIESISESKRITTIPATYETASLIYTIVPHRHKGAVMETVTETILVKEESNRTIPIPATYETVHQTILVKPESKRFIQLCEGCPCIEQTVPAEYKTINRQVVRTPATYRTETIPAEYVSFTAEKVSEDGNGGVLLPAESTYITKQVLKTREIVQETLIPAKIEMIPKQVIKTPAQCKEIEVPNGSKTISIRQLIQPAHYEKVAIPCGQGTFELREKQHPAQYETVTIYDEKGNIKEYRKIEVSPAYQTYEVTKRL